MNAWDEIIAENESDAVSQLRSSQEWSDGWDCWENLGTSGMNPFNRAADEWAFRAWEDGFNAARLAEEAA